MERIPTREYQLNESEEIVIIDGKKYRKILSGYTIREFYSHNTIEKGPGPGWDSRREILEKYGVKEPQELPAEPHYELELIEENNIK